MDDHEAVAREYKQVQIDLKDTGSKLKQFAEQARSDVTRARDETNKLSARLQDIEQKFARRGEEAEPPHGSRSDVAGAVLKALEDDASYHDAVHAAKRNMKLSAFASRANVDTSIKMALVGGGYGAAGGTSGYPSAPERGKIVTAPVRPLRLLDVLPTRPTSSDSVEFVRVSAIGHAAEQESDGDEKAELGVDSSLERAEIATVAAWTSASKQVLADHAALGQTIDTLIRNKVLDRLEARLVAGFGGVGGRISGFLEQATPFSPTTAINPADRVGEAISDMAAKGYRPQVIVLHPADWFRLSITREKWDVVAGYGGPYLFGSPTNPMQHTLWNVPVVLTPSVGEHNALVIDTNYTTVLDREQISVQISNSHADFFVRNLIAVLGEMRAGLEVLDQGAVVSLSIGTEPSSTD